MTLKFGVAPSWHVLGWNARSSSFLKLEVGVEILFKKNARRRHYGYYCESVSREIVP